VPTKEITQSFVIVGEGAGDAAFFAHLCDMHTIPGFQCLDAGGSGKFEQYLKDLPALSGFRKNCRLLLVVGDNEDEPDKSFIRIRTALKKAKLPAPNASLQLVKHTTEDLQVVIMMLPLTAEGESSKGCLETVLLRCAFEHNPEIARCIPSFGECIEVGKWTKSTHVDKFKLRALLAAAFPDDPNFGLQYALSPQHDVIPLKHKSLDPIVEFLRSLPSKL
jgi:hypothetical protein